jgi:hypothetical protein
MPEEIVGEVAGGIVRFVGRILFAFLFEVLIRGVGYSICRAFNRNVTLESGWSAGVGIAFWTLVAALIYVAAR